MARLTVTAAAMAHIRAALASRPLARPVLTVYWSPGMKDVKRGPKGETIWETTEEVGWKVHLTDWADAPEDMHPTERLPDVDVWLSTHGRKAISEVIVDHANNEYVVSERAI
jgi:hypothetical protein